MTLPLYALPPWSDAKHPFVVGLPVLAGETGETLFPAASPKGEYSAFALAQAGRWQIGRASVPVDEGCELAAFELYRSLLAAVGTSALCRIWNFVPRINGIGVGGLENYRAFCCGRSRAFEEVLGPGFERCLPAASAVGTEDGRLTVLFAACATVPRLVENPAQVAAYRYPENYGPRPPSFSRAAVVPDACGKRDVFISGTAAVTGCETIFPGETEGQLAGTIRNLRLIAEACGLGNDLGRGSRRHFKVYLRHAADLGLVQPALEQALFSPQDKVAYLRADICRADLNLEVEATVTECEC